MMQFFGGRPRGGAPSADAATYNKFTARARSALTLAQDEAERLRYTFIDTEHLLLGLLRETDGVAAWVLRAQGIDLDMARARALGLMRQVTGPDDRIETNGPGETPLVGLTPAATSVIQLAVQEAVRLRHHYLGTEHLLLGLLREGKGLPAQALASLGVTLVSAREGVVAATNLAMTPRTSPDDEPSTAFLQAAQGADARQDDLSVVSPLDANTLEAVDTLVWAGLHATRGAALAWLAESGIATHQQFIADLRRRRAHGSTVAEQTLPQQAPDERAHE